MKPRLLLIATALIMLGASVVPADMNKLDERLSSSAHVLQEIMGSTDKSIPQSLLDRSEAIVVIPSVLKGGFILGGKYGRGVESARSVGSPGWSAPAFIAVGGGSFGLQIGGQSVDYVLLIMNSHGLESLLKDKFEIGVDASVAAGPVGRNADAKTDALLRAEIISYSRSRGVFAGVTLNGAVMNQDKDANKEMYKRDISAREILLENKVKSPAQAAALLKLLGRYSPKQVK